MCVCARRMWCGCEWIRHSICLVNSGTKQKRSWMVMGGCSWVTLASLHVSATDFCWCMKNLKWFRNSQPYTHIHTHTGYDAKTLKSRQHLHFFSVNWWSKHDFPTPMSPTKTKERERNGDELSSEPCQRPTGKQGSSAAHLPIMMYLKM